MRFEAQVDGVSISNADKVWWPDERITKLDIVRYYAELAPRLLPWLKDRPLVAERCPDGMLGQCFFQKNFARGLPASIPREGILAESTGRTVKYVVGGAKETLLALVNLGCIVDEHGIRSYPKTSGGRGLHVLVPLRRGPDQDATRAFARDLAGRLAERAPDVVTVAMSKQARQGRTFIDTLRNAFGQTIVPPYAVRRRPRAPVSTPLAWEEVDPRLDPARFNIRTLDRRLAGADPWSDFWRHRQSISAPVTSKSATSIDSKSAGAHGDLR